MTFFATVRRKRGESVKQETSLSSDTIAEKRERVRRALAMDPEAIWEDDLTVQQIMSTCLSTVGADSRFSEIKKKMARQRLRHLLVTDSEGRLQGIISDRDVLRRNGIFANQVMTKDPLSMPPQSKIRDAINIMLTKRISCLPIVHNGKPIGILTTTDLMLSLQSVLEIVARPPAVSTVTSATQDIGVAIDA